MTSMIERVARAIHASRLTRLTRFGYDEGLAFDQLPVGVRGIICADARAAIEAMREPTEGMLAAMKWDAGFGFDLTRAYGKMWDNALTAALDGEG